MTVTPDSIATLVLQQFEKLPAKRKPLVRDNGIHEWVPLSGIVAQGLDSKLHCIAIATGMKCLPTSKLPLAQGNVLHDWHAEVLAIRAFNRFILDEAKALSQGTVKSSEFLQPRDHSELLHHQDGNGNGDAGRVWHGQPFAWREGVKLHMYCSEAPCGDASMELTMAAQTDSTPWDVPPSCSLHQSNVGGEGQLPGRAYFSHLGLVRRKPARSDAPPTLSKSCSDKLSLKQCTSLLSSLTSLFVCPANVYIDRLVLPASQYSASGCARAFSSEGRMAGLTGRDWKGGYEFRPFGVETSDREFGLSKRSVKVRAGEGGQTAASNLAVAWTRSGLEEGTLGGILQGRKAFDPRGASFASRRKMWALAVEIAALLGMGVTEVQKALAANSYGDIKNSKLLEARRRVKEDAVSEALKGWVKNRGDDAFSLGLSHQSRQ
ncbi:adenosine-deaminase domain-containing protein [Pseudomassariella vexata]|uniref:Adenosine-deaminase domain-containing protein n=1 Tax=Pseudomassariella vexata TaxID=1141098 RepID=A0A1Y2DMY0_9PEZI|nr:adenosine-deaminase domain-containing protein [Pseudomassariella vexata]ORY60529.1 adenosine-deaminase domain-containing protein [Pseudomassariella vexata]